MFILRSTHEKEIRRLKAEAKLIMSDLGVARNRYDQLIDKWNKLVARVNARGGESFLSGETAPRQFTKDELRQLIALCHPDKHGGSQAANDITAKLLSLRK
jgi:hypothetical protein